MTVWSSVSVPVKICCSSMTMLAAFGGFDAAAERSSVPPVTEREFCPAIAFSRTAPTALFQLSPQMLLSFPVTILRMPRVGEKVSAAMSPTRVIGGHAVGHVSLAVCRLDQGFELGHLFLILGIV